jgi:uncharacterized protein
VRTVAGDTRGRAMLQWLFLFVVITSVLLAGLYFGQRRLIYMPNPHPITPSDIGAREFKMVDLKTRDNLTLKSWYHKAQSSKQTLLYLHGNAGNVANRVVLVQSYIKHGYGVLLLSYRGYAGNPGTPTEQGLYNDARAAIEFLQQQHVSYKDIILFGESIGTGVAVQMATEYPVAAIILQSPYSSLVDVAKYHYPFMPVEFLMKDRFDSIDKISQVRQPLLVLHGERDTIVPIKFGEKLFEKANKPKVFKRYPEFGHNNIVSNRLQQDVLDFIKSISVVPYPED